MGRKRKIKNENPRNSAFAETAPQGGGREDDDIVVPPPQKRQLVGRGGRPRKKKGGRRNRSAKVGRSAGIELTALAGEGEGNEDYEKKDLSLSSSSKPSLPSEIPPPPAPPPTSTATTTTRRRTRRRRTANSSYQQQSSDTTHPSSPSLQCVVIANTNNGNTDDKPLTKPMPPPLPRPKTMKEITHHVSFVPILINPCTTSSSTFHQQQSSSQKKQLKDKWSSMICAMAQFVLKQQKQQKQQKLAFKQNATNTKAITNNASSSTNSSRKSHQPSLQSIQWSLYNLFHPRNLGGIPPLLHTNTKNNTMLLSLMNENCIGGDGFSIGSILFEC